MVVIAFFTASGADMFDVILTLFSFYIFHHSREEAMAAIQEAQQQLEILRRQAVLGKLYPSARSVMEAPTAHA
jgi:hypothetical protein